MKLLASAVISSQLTSWLSQLIRLKFSELLGAVILTISEIAPVFKVDRADGWAVSQFFLMVLVLLAPYTF